jgi:hypothetical protein
MPEGREYGKICNANAVDVHALVFAGLRGLGFRESEVREALAGLAWGEGEPLTAEMLLRESLLRLTADRAQS